MPCESRVLCVAPNWATTTYTLWPANSSLIIFQNPTGNGNQGRSIRLDIQEPCLFRIIPCFDPQQATGIDAKHLVRPQRPALNADRLGGIVDSHLLHTTHINQNAAITRGRIISGMTAPLNRQINMVVPGKAYYRRNALRVDWANHNSLYKDR